MRRQRVRWATRFIGVASHAIALHPKLAILLVCVIPLAIRFALLPILPVPAPSIHDEFSNLLSADTFLHGRLANPTPPAWQHFETFHELVRPTYASVYPPGIGLLLAGSRIVFGHPWWGVAISASLMTLAVIWMVRAWLTPFWTLFAGLLIGLQFGIVHYWVNGYWGGTIPGIGGSLLIGAYGRLRKRFSIWPAIAYGAGSALLLSTRPYEGGVLILTVSGAMLWAMRSSPDRLKTIAYLTLTGALFVIPVLIFITSENKAVTGNRFQFPHELYRLQYGVLPSFAWEPALDHTYNHPLLKEFFYEWEPNLEDAKQWGTIAGIIPCTWARLRAAGQFVPDIIYYPLALISVVAAFFPRMRFLGVCFLCGLIANALVNWLTSHYLAPVLGPMIAIHIYFLRYLRAALRRGGFGDLALVTVVLLLIVSFGIRFYTKTGIPWDKEWAYQREQMIARLSNSAQPCIIFVKYSPGHDVVREWVFNDADIPSQKVIWVRYMSPAADSAVSDAFPGRSTWLLEPDQSLDLHPYVLNAH